MVFLQGGEIMAKVNEMRIIQKMADMPKFEGVDESLMSSIVCTFIDVIKDELIKGNTVNLIKFLTFKIEEAKPKRAWSFQQKKTIQLEKDFYLRLFLTESL